MNVHDNLKENNMKGVILTHGLGILALVLWATSATVFMSVKGLPQFQVLTMMFFCSAIAGLLMSLISGGWRELRQVTPVSILALFGGIVVQQIIYISALKYAPPAEVDIITYLWPLVSVVLSVIFLGSRLSLLQILGLVMGVTAVVLVGRCEVCGNELTLGHCMAALSALCWGVYTTFVHRLVRISILQLAIAYSLGFLAVLPIHLSFESYVSPTGSNWCCVAYISLLPGLIGYILWTKAMQARIGSPLVLVAYAKPVMSVLLLWLFGYAEASWSLWIATVLVFMAGIFSLEQGEKIKSGIRHESVATIRALLQKVG